MVWIMRSSTPLMKAISATAVLTIQLGPTVYLEERNDVEGIGSDIGEIKERGEGVE